MRLQQLRENKHEQFDRIKDQIDLELYLLRYKSSQRQLIKKLEEALYDVGRKDVWQAIKDCSVGQRCGSLWCPVCRSQAALASANKINDRIQALDLNNDDLLHVTAPVGLASFNVEDVNRVLKEDDLRWKRIRKKNGFWIEATYEFELVNLRHLMNSKGSDMKKIQMRQMVQASGMRDNEFLFIHWHGVTDIDRDDVDKVFREEYFIGSDRLHKTSSCGLYVQKFHKDQGLNDNVKRVSSYPFKSVYRFKHTFKGSDFLNGEFLTTEELGKLVSVYHDVQGRQWRRLRRHNG